MQIKSKYNCISNLMEKNNLYNIQNISFCGSQVRDYMRVSKW